MQKRLLTEHLIINLTFTYRWGLELGSIRNKNGES